MTWRSVVREHRPFVVGSALLLPLIACAAMSGFRATLTSDTEVLVLVLLVVGAASTGDRVAGVVAALSAMSHRRR